MMAIGILAFVVALLTSVMLHEAGHFVTAKLFGMKATQFFVGFGPTLWSRQKGETEYGIKGIPAGGYVKIIGMTPLEDVAVEDQPRAFINKPGWQRFIVLVAGSSMHFVIALVLLFIILLGWPSIVRGQGMVGSVQDCVTSAADVSCPAGAVAAPAKGKLQANDVITAVDGHPVVHGTAQVVSLTSHASPGPLTFTVQRAGKSLDIVMTPVRVDGKSRVGIDLRDAPNTRYDRVAVGGAVTGSLKEFGTLFTGSFKALGAVPRDVAQLAGHSQARRTTDPATGSGGLTSVVGIAQFAGEAFKAEGVSGGVFTLLGLIAAVNIFVGIFNLFPFLPLDGGHVAILGYEKVRNAWRRMRHLVPAGPVDLNKLMPLTYGVLVIIVAVSALILFADISNPVANPFQ
jgi:membrane-associated protease RseP (regulator of RpoE activity)